MSKQQERAWMWFLTLSLAMLCMVVFPLAASLLAQAQPEVVVSEALNVAVPAASAPTTTTTTPVLIGFAGIVSYLIQKMKDGWLRPFVEKHMDLVVKIVAGIGAGLVSVGITTSWDPAIGRLAFDGLPTSFDAGVDMFLAWFGQYWLQKAWYVLGMKPNNLLAEIRAMMTSPQRPV